MAPASIPAFQRLVPELKVTLVHKISSRTGRAAQSKPVSENNNNRTNKQKVISRVSVASPQKLPELYRGLNRHSGVTVDNSTIVKVHTHAKFLGTHL